MITIQSASTYSTKGEIAYQITYSDGTEVRAVVGGGLIRKEYKAEAGEWKMVGKPYVVKHNSKRDAERIKSIVERNLASA